MSAEFLCGACSDVAWHVRRSQENGGVSHHRRDIGQHVRVRHRLRHDLGRLQLETQLPMVSPPPPGSLHRRIAHSAWTRFQDVRRYVHGYFLSSRLIMPGLFVGDACLSQAFAFCISVLFPALIEFRCSTDVASCPPCHYAG